MYGIALTRVLDLVQGPAVDSTCAHSACHSVSSEAPETETETQTRLALELNSRGCVPHRFVRVPAHYYRCVAVAIDTQLLLLLAKQAVGLQ